MTLSCIKQQGIRLENSLKMNINVDRINNNNNNH